MQADTRQPTTKVVNVDSNGFSLLELLITVAIVGILFSIALPSYQNHLLKSRRVAAYTSMLAASQAMQRHRVQYYSFSGAKEGETFNTRVPTDLNKKQSYRLSLEITERGRRYQITAQSVYDQALKLNSEQLSIDSLGIKTWKFGSQRKQCWPQNLLSC